MKLSTLTIIMIVVVYVCVYMAGQFIDHSQDQIRLTVQQLQQK